MNKKHLSVVMAGAMLATSVAPVLAATERTVNESNKGLLIKELRELLNSKKFSDLADNNTYKSGSSDFMDKDMAGKSVYAIRIKDENGNITKYDADSIDALETKIKALKAGSYVQVYNRGFVEKDGKIYNHYLEETKEVSKFTEASLKAVADDFNGSKTGSYSAAILGMEYANGVLKVKTRKAANESEYVYKEYKAGDNERDFGFAVNKDGERITGSNDWKAFEDFDVKSPVVHNVNDNIDRELVETIHISDVDNAYSAKLSDLYDGLFLTANGQKVLDTIKEYRAKGFTANVAPVNNSGKGIYTVDVTFTKTVAGGASSKQVLTISSNNKDQLELVKGWLDNAEAPVQILAGSNRYETAVKVAKENADITTVAANGNLVLVNGNSLVDGLAAAPLAATVVNGVTAPTGAPGQYVSPILLTDTNGIPKETKAYMKELIGEQKIKDLDKLTVYLVGGEAVISPAVEKDLKEIGFRVVRAGGKDREATSLAVANLMTKENGVDPTNAFVVGADGEADAMSIAAKASEKKQPIIVESRKGISEDTVNYLKGFKQSTASAKDVTIVGGEAVVSKATETKLSDEKLKVERLAGSNRQSTNAKVIKTYYPNSVIRRIVVSKDGQKNKSELIDALTATSLAVKYGGPVVLATNKLSNEQINSLELKANKNGIYAYQVGHGVARDVMKTIAERVGLAK